MGLDWAVLLEIWFCRWLWRWEVLTGRERGFSMLFPFLKILQDLMRIGSLCMRFRFLLVKSVRKYLWRFVRIHVWSVFFSPPTEGQPWSQRTQQIGHFMTSFSFNRFCIFVLLLLCSLPTLLGFCHQRHLCLVPSVFKSRRYHCGIYTTRATRRQSNFPAKSQRRLWLRLQFQSYIHKICL